MLLNTTYKALHGLALVTSAASILAILRPPYCTHTELYSHLMSALSATPVHMLLPYLAPSPSLFLLNSNAPFWFQLCCYFSCTTLTRWDVLRLLPPHPLLPWQQHRQGTCPKFSTRMSSDYKKTLKYLWQTLLVPSQEPSFLFINSRSPVLSPMLTRLHSALPQGISQSWWESTMVNQLILARYSLFQTPLQRRINR